MLEFLHPLFSGVCGQSLAHTWLPGGEALPCCQRCTGIYVGAFVAALWHLVWQPVVTRRWLGLNGAFLLFMLPSGFYWIPQNPELRCASGILFGFGQVAFLCLCLPCSATNWGLKKISSFEIGSFMSALLACLLLTPLLAAGDSFLVANLLAAFTAGGALVLLVLLLWNITAVPLKSPVNIDDYDYW